MAFVKVAEANAVKPGYGEAVEAAGKDLALFNVDGTFYCLDNVCPHAGAPLDGGWLDGTVVTCPWHAWEIDLTTGEVTFDPGTCVATYECKIEDGAVLVNV